MRVDDGVAEGGEVSMFYDPMIAKLITSGDDPRRRRSTGRSRRSTPSEIEGIGHNVDFLSALMQHPRFRVGRAHHRLHRRGISRRLPRRAGGRGAADARSPRSPPACRSARPRRAAPDRGQLGEPVPPPCDWTVAHRRRASFQVTLGEGACAWSTASAVERTARLAAGRPAGRAPRSTARRCGSSVERKRRSGWRLTTRGARHQVIVYPAACRRSVAAHDREGAARSFQIS